jgi:hypothetical protein
VESSERKRELRKILLNKLVEQILAGKFNSQDVILNNRRNKEYLSPLERDSYNYGYMTNDQNNKG